jgi:hypothetical protein
MGKQSRALYISSVDMRANNGMAQGHHQLLSALCSVYGENVDLLSAAASVKVAQAWLQRAGFRVNVLRGIYPALARWNTALWYGGGAVLCNKLRLIDHFHFPIHTPMPKSWIDRYEVIVCYYAWHHRLLRLERAGAKVVVDTGDVMADRHERTGARRWITLASSDEKAVLQSSSRSLAVSKDDADEFQRLYGVRPRLLSFVPPEHAELLELAAGDRPPRIGYMGAPSYVNEEVLRVLSDPLFLEQISKAGIELLIAGGICNTADRAILAALEKGGARILGKVPSTADFYRQICTTVNPVGPSTGVKIKSVETLVAGRTLVTTRWGADASLAEAFPGQVVYIDWPMDTQALGRQCIEAVRSAQLKGNEAASAYVVNSTRALEEILSE